jgi:hypothetical protein
MYNDNKKAAHTLVKHFAACETDQSYFTKTTPLCKRYPPFGKQLHQFLQQGLCPANDIYIFVGIHAWGKAKTLFMRPQWVTLLPPDSTPDQFYWGFVKGFPVLTFDTGGIDYVLIRRLAFELLKAGATIVHVVLNCSQLIVFRQEVSDAR